MHQVPANPGQLANPPAVPGVIGAPALAASSPFPMVNRSHPTRSSRSERLKLPKRQWRTRMSGRDFWQLELRVVVGRKGVGMVPEGIERGMVSKGSAGEEP